MADESTAYGNWERVGEEAFELDRSIPAVRFRWQAPERFGHFTIDFQSTESQPERRFYPIEVLSSLLRHEPADDFAERVCRFGVDLLPELEETCRDWVGDLDPTLYVGKEFPCRETLEFLLAMFISRRTGHARVTRGFNRWDDFVDTTHSVCRPESLVPGIALAKRAERSSGTDVLNLIQKHLTRTNHEPVRTVGREDRLDASPLRTPLDQILVHGVFRDDGHPGTLSFAKVIESVAPALIDGIQVEHDSNYLAEHAKDFRHFVSRLTERYFYDRSGFGRCLRQESEKGFVRLLPGFKQFDRVAREAAREKGHRFYRRVLWTAYEAMSRSYGAVALWAWVSFTRSTVVAPSPEEEAAFRWYNAPMVCTGGLPLWFLGPNLLS